MNTEIKDQKSRGYVRMRMILDIGMGIIYVAVALFILFAKKFGFSSQFFDPPFAYFFSAICILYGGFRIYRGVKKNYFR